ncbi:MAG: hypothetical protein MZV49_05650 [Rhodopseudomonas palustris]|nr:hypothetical protein [Rhodopseudomonas palustris]
MPIKRVLCPERLRSVPAQFSWVDHRLVRDRHIDRCDAQAGALYLFLVTVADAQGLSYYSDAVLARRLSMAPRPPRPGARRSAWRGTHRLSATPLPSPGPGRAAARAERARWAPTNWAPGSSGCVPPWGAHRDRLRDVLQDPGLS